MSLDQEDGRPRSNPSIEQASASMLIERNWFFQTSMEEVARGDPKVNQSSLLQKLLSEWLQANNALHGNGIYVIYVWT